MVSMSASKAFPGFSNIYELGEGSFKTFRGDISMSRDDAWRVLRAEKSPPGPVEVRYAMGRSKPSDLLFTTLATPVLISARVLGILQAEGFTGWQTYPLHVFGKDGAPIPGYHGLAVHGRCGPIDESRSVKLDKIYPGGVFPKWYGLFFDPATWDGSDLFMTAGPHAWVFVVESVKRAFEKAKVTNVKFTALDQLELARLD
jgi:uncharacterized protein DUF1629